ncbi:MAG: substrate-binding domain-containing protein [Arenicellales bacterium]|jgi:tungstate transport system substrate-binding protein|nr:tungsten ABC transporter substrate-binding protein [Acidiferrobacteraceae bacterium]MDP6290187.1 substrate-binding domain-containing protein [Arenicellales bacterium]MDP6435513.1 substrate-binding domain-containing protein [Arenicellales bacterium]MDP6672212.1 substrate-binding domain-containing protein [Arenicellales bacterium]MDP6723758.1 substrate-binding domain-containing protein [Arenicellales bacterium]|tara:strand:+ start:81029 stop:81853 length:825 start_codon:yes stop_codon:yes gene_type:complete
MRRVFIGWKRIVLLLGTVMLFNSGVAMENGEIKLATTTSTVNSGLLDQLLPVFTRASGIRVKVIAVGTGKALKMGVDGDVDIVLVHAPKAETQFVASGSGVGRRQVMYNDFVVVGPLSDPADIKNASNIDTVFNRIANKSALFISRGDDSGTHKKELLLWKRSSLDPDGVWYREVGQGMGRTLQIANELQGYTLTDRGTWLATRDQYDLDLLFSGDSALFNPYGIIPVNPKRHPHVNYAAASRFAEWLVTPATGRLIANYRVGGEQLFVPMSGE